ESPKPILIDLDREDGVEILPQDESFIFIDAGGDGLLHRTAWADSGDGVLFYDPENTGEITEKSQYVFTEWDPTAPSDLEALASIFDSNGDGVFNAGDAAFDDFKIMVTADDLSTHSKTLTELGITEIDLSGDATRLKMPDGSMITGQTTFKWADGGTGTIADVALVAETQGHRLEQVESYDINATRTLTVTAYNGDGSIAYEMTSVTSEDGAQIANSYDDNGDGVVDRLQTIDTLTNPDGSKVETQINKHGADDATAVLANRTVTTTSADTLVVTIERDSTGGGWFDQREVRTTHADDSRTIATSDLAQDGTIIRSVSETVSIDGLQRIEAIDEDGDGTADLTITHDIVNNGDGSRSETITSTNADGSLRGVVTEEVGTDGRSRDIHSDIDGDGDIDIREVLAITVAPDGQTTSTMSVENGDGSVRSSTTTQQSADTLSKTTQMDLDGDGDIDLSEVDTTVINADGSRETTLTHTNSDGSVRAMSKDILGADKVSKEQWVDLNQNGIFEATDLVSELTVDGTTQVRTTDEYQRNADGTVISSTQRITSSDGQTVNTTSDLDGDGDTDISVSDITITNADNSSTRTVEMRNGDNSLRSRTVTDTSADGLTIETSNDIDGDGTIDGWSKTEIVLNADNSVTRTVSQYAGDGTTLLSHRVVDESADRLTTVISVDDDGDGNFDSIETTTESLDGAKTVSTTTYNADGTTSGTSSQTISANSLVSTRTTDANADGIDDSITTRTTTYNNDGSVTRSVDINNGDGSDSSLEVTNISDDGLVQITETDRDGNGTFERKVVSDTTLNSDGSRTTLAKTLAEDGNLLSQTETNVSGDGLVTITKSDGDGDGTFDLIRTNTTLLYSDGSTEVISELRDALDVLREKEISVISDNGRSTTITRDINGDGVTDQSITIVIADDGTKTTTTSNLDKDGAVQSRILEVVSDDGLTTTASEDMDGDGVYERKVISVSVLNNDGSTTTTETREASDGSIISKTVFVTSDDGLSSTINEDWDNDGSDNLVTESSKTIEVDGDQIDSVTIKSADGNVSSSRTTETSADGKTIIETSDQDGNGQADVTIILQEQDDGSVIKTTNYHSTGGTVHSKKTQIISDDGLSVVTSLDLNNDGYSELIKTDVTSLKGNGFIEQNIAYRNDRFVQLASDKIIRSDDGLYSLATRDLDGDGIAEFWVKEITSFNLDGSTLQEFTSHSTTNELLAEISIETSGDGLTQFTRTDYDGINGADRHTTSVVGADGSRSVTTEEYKGGYQIARSSTLTISADGRHQLFNRDLDGDGKTDHRTTTELDLSGNNIETIQDLDFLGLAQSTITKTVSANGIDSEIEFDVDGDGDVNFTSSRDTTFLNDGSIVSSRVDKGANGNAYYTAQTTTSADELTSTTLTDVDGDGSVDKTTTRTITLNDDGSRTVEKKGVYAGGDLAYLSTEYSSYDGRTSSYALDIDGDGINDYHSETSIASDGRIVKTGATYNEAGYTNNKFAVTTTADGLTTTTVRSDSIQKIVRSPIGDENYTYEYSAIAAPNTPLFTSSHKVDNLGIETWNAVQSSISLNKTIRLDGEAKAWIFAEAAKIFDTILDRDVDYFEYEQLIVHIDNGQLDVDALTSQLINSSEFSTRYGTISDAEFIIQLYLNSHNRAPELAELDEGINALSSSQLSRVEFAIETAQSTEHVVVGNGHRHTNNYDVILNPVEFERSLDQSYMRTVISQIIDVVYDRDATDYEIEYYLDRMLNQTDNLDDIAQILLGKDGDIQGTPTNSLKGLSTADLVKQAFINAFDRSPTAEEQNIWELNISSGSISSAQFIASIALTIEHLETAKSHLADNYGSPVINTGTASAETLTGTSDQDFMVGLDGNDTLKGGPKSDVLIGGLGDDNLKDGDGSDRYEWSKDDGNDTLNDTADSLVETDVLVLTDVASDDVSLTRV
ncbi:MAG: DUF4214 domain-containing protein, partial [Gammaproteobacteria bacterium]|nr:DUF4214 domain-containing protein [Gammaproteobacteria bacterium]